MPCHIEINRYVWNKRQGKTIEVTLYFPCWKKANPRKEKGSSDTSKNHSLKDETSALLVGEITNVPNVETAGVNSRKTFINTPRAGKNEIILDHHIFHSEDGWKKSESMAHPTLKLCLTTEPEDYSYIGVDCPNISPSYVTAIRDAYGVFGTSIDVVSMMQT